MDVLHMRNFKDFLLLYNQISETCFKRCMNTFLSRDISFEEDLCVKKCVEKHVHGNHKMMEIFVEVQPILMQKRIEEIEQTQAALQEKSQTALQEQTQTALQDKSQTALQEQTQTALQEQTQTSLQEQTQIQESGE